jgi:hypothetical protein
VQHTEEADLRTQMLRVAGDGAQRLRRCPEQDIVHHGLVLERDDLNLRRRDGPSIEQKDRRLTLSRSSQRFMTLRLTVR